MKLPTTCSIIMMLLTVTATPATSALTTYDAAALGAQVAVNQACATGGRVVFPESFTLTTTLTIACGSDTKNAVMLEGSPTALQCNTGAAPCIRFGSTSGVQMTGHQMNHFRLYGPGRTVAGSIGVKITGRGQGGAIRNVEIRHFDTGLSYDGDPATGYLFDWQFDNLRIGVQDNVQGISPNVNLAIQLYGEVTGVFYHANLAAVSRSIRMYGPSGSGANVEFVDARLNQSSTNAGTGAVWVQSGALTIKSGDVEGSYPQFQLTGGALIIHDTTFTGDPNNSGSNPLISVPGASQWFLEVDNSSLAGPAGVSPSNGPVIKIYDPSGLGTTRITDSTFFGGATNAIELLSAAGDTVISGNIITGGGVYLESAKNVSITNNSIFNAQNNSIRLTGATANVVIEGNRIRRWNGSAASFPAIEVTDFGTQDRISIRGNLISDPLSGSPRAIHCGNRSPRPSIQVTFNSVSRLGVTGSCLSVKNK